MDNLTTLLDLRRKIAAFVNSKGWDKSQAHTVKNICINIACEAAELMEVFIWQKESDIPVIVRHSNEPIKRKIADIAFSLLDLCNQLTIDLADAVDEKLLLHAKKYPADEAYTRTYITDEIATVANLKSKLKKFCDQRNWDQNAQSINSLGLSIVCEAAELMDIFNWKTEAEIPQVIKEKKDEIRYEIADITFALLSFCNELSIDLSNAIEEKIIINA